MTISGQAHDEGLFQDRWTVSGRNIVWHVGPDESHLDHLEMSGKQVSAIITYGQAGSRLKLLYKIIYPLLRTIPNLTHASTICEYSQSGWPQLALDGNAIQEQLVRVTFDGTLVLVTEDSKHRIRIERRIWPATDQPAVLEQMMIANLAAETIRITLPVISQLDYGRGSKGVYLLQVNRSQMVQDLAPGQTCHTSLQFSGRIAGQPVLACDPARSLRQRQSLIASWDQSLVLKTPDPVISLAFRYAKRRTCESIFLNRCGLLHSPGGGSYYAAIWTNDQIEYAAPLFPFTGYPVAIEASLNAGRLFTPFMAENYHPIPSSIIAEGQDIWEGAGDRGDASMYVYGMSRFLLALADYEQARNFWPYLMWCLVYNRLHKNEAGVICSDSDELEGRFPTGRANLSTSCLAYGGLVSAACLAAALGMSETADQLRAEAHELHQAIERYFGATVEGFRTYRYYDGNTTLRSWLAIPLAVGILDRSEETVAALLSPRLWSGNGLVTESGSTVFWDRATLYGLRGIFYAGAHEAAGERLADYSRRRLLGDHVPYPVEAWPEGNQRHLAAESALYCRVLTEGVFGIEPKGFRSFTLRPSLPQSWPAVQLSHIRAFADDFSISITRAGDNLVIQVTDQSDRQQTVTIPDGSEILIDLDAVVDT